MTNRSIIRVVVGAAMAVSSSGLLIGGNSSPLVQAASTSVLPFEVVGPPGSEEFGERVLVLSNGNYVVVDEFWDDGPVEDVGAVYLYDGVTNQLISQLTGSTAGDRVGRGFAHEVGTSDFVVLSSAWDGPGGADVGAATWIDGRAGMAGPVTPQNSLVGGTAGDGIGMDNRVKVLANGNYVLTTRSWANSDGADVGAVTWGDGEEGVAGVVSSANSMVGSSAGDLELLTVTSLASGHYVVSAQAWDNGDVSDAGVVTWGDGETGTTGVIGDGNSLVGSSAGDLVGERVTPLTNGSFVIASPDWNDGATQDVGAATWSDGTAPVVGAVSGSNSLIGSQPGDRVGQSVQELSNGNYVVVSAFWSNGEASGAGAVTWGGADEGVVGPVTSANSSVGVSENEEVDEFSPLGALSVQLLADGDYLIRRKSHGYGAIPAAGAVTWGDGDVGATGEVSQANSLVGASPGDRVGDGAVVELANGNYVIHTPSWDNGPVDDAGAITWADGAAMTAGTVSSANSLVGSTTDDFPVPDDFVAEAVFAISPLSTGDYVVSTSFWDDGATADVGAVTLLDGDSASSGIVSVANSLIGSRSGDLDSHGVYVAGGNVVVGASSWDDGATADVGAAMLIDGDAGTSGTIDATRALVGTSEGDAVGDWVTVLDDGDYVVASPAWDDGGVENVGAITWADGSTGIVGPVSVANSLIGSSADDLVGNTGVSELTGGDFIVATEVWNGGAVANVGAVTWVDGSVGLSGVVSQANSLIGSSVDDRVGSRVVALADGDALVSSKSWDRGATADAGALTRIDGSVGTIGVVSEANSLVGSAADDRVGSWIRLQPFADLGIAISNEFWGGGRGAVTFVPSGESLVGEVTSSNSAIGTLPGEVLGSAVEPSGTVSAAGSMLYGTSQGRVLGLQAQVEPGPGDGALVSLTPGRVLDTRADGSTVDGASEGVGRLGAGGVIEVPVVGRAGVPADGVSGVVVNVTAVNPLSRGFVTLYPCEVRPVTSSLNFSSAGTVVGNELVAKVSTAGSLCVYSSAETDLTVDVSGFVPDDTAIVSLDPARFLDTRIDGSSTVDGASQAIGRVEAGEVVELDVAGRGAVPESGVSAVVVNITAVNPSERGFVTVFACGERPVASSLNFSSAGVVAGNELVAKLSPEGSLCVFSSGQTDLTADVAGFVESGAGFVSLDPARILDTRTPATGGGTIDDVAERRGMMGSMRVVEVPVLGRGGVPDSGVSAVVMNVTAINPLGRGFVTSFPCSVRPTTSGLNYAAAGVVVGNEVVAKVSVSGTVCLYTSTATHLTADVVAHIPD